MSKGQATPTMAEVILQAVKARMIDLRVCLPAKIERYTPSEQKADITPLLRKKYKLDNAEVDMPVITNVPVQWPSAGRGSSFLHLPLKAGDLGMAIFCDRSLDLYLSGDGSKVTPNDVRMHNITDAIFIPGVLPFKVALEDIPADNAVLQNGSMRMEIDPSGKISFEGATKEFLTIMDSVIDHLISARIVSGIGSTVFTEGTIASFQSDKDDLGTIKRV